MSIKTQYVISWGLFQSGIRQIIGVTLGFWVYLSACSQSVPLQKLPGQYHDYVSALCEDRHGMLWIGTAGGLYRYDGLRMTHFAADPANPSALSNAFVDVIEEDSFGRMWLWTKEGLNIFDEQKDRFIRLEWPFRSGQSWVRGKFYEISAGKYFLHLQGYTNYVLHFPENATSGKDAVFQPDDSPISRELDSFLDGEGSVWAKEISKFRCLYGPRKGDTLSFEAFLPDADRKRLPDILDSRDFRMANLGDRMALSTFNGVLEFNANLRQAHFFPYPDSSRKALPNNASAVLAYLRDGNLLLHFVNSFEYLMLDRKKGIWQRYCFVDTAPDNPLRNPGLYVRSDGSWWFSTPGLGLFFIDPGGMRFRKPPNQVIPGVFRSVFELRDGSLIEYKEKRYNYRKDPNLPPERVIQTIHKPIGQVWHHFEARDGTIWGAYENGVLQMEQDDGGSLQIRKWFDAAEIEIPLGVGMNATMFAQAADGRLYLLACNRLCSLDTARQVFETLIDFDIDGKVSSFLPTFHLTASGIIWIGHTGGLIRYETATGKTEMLNLEKGNLPFNHITSIVPDPRLPEAVLWLGTYGGGLLRYDCTTRKSESFGTEDGLPDAELMGLLPDDGGKFWMSHSKGVSRFDPETAVFSNFDAQDGLLASGYNSKSAYKGRDGLLYFGGTDGLSIFDPSTIQKSVFEPPILFTRLLLANKESKFEDLGSPLKAPIFLTDTLVLTYRDNAFSLEWAAQDFRCPERIRYAYLLENFDQDWQEIGTESKATFTNLDPGKYRLKIRSTNSDGIWFDQQKSLMLIITPPWYETWWARSLFILTGLLLIYVVYRFQLNRRTERMEAKRIMDLEAIKSRLYTNFTHEFRTPLTIINGLIEDLDIPPQSKKIIGRNSQTLLGLVNQLLDLAKMDAGELTLHLRQSDVLPYLHYLAESLRSMAVRKDVDLVVTAGRQSLFMDFDEERLKHILNNLLSNAIKFTDPGGRVEVQFSVSKENMGEWLKIMVKDSGRGIRAEKFATIFERFSQIKDDGQSNTGGTGIGLSVVKELCELMGGTVELESEWGKGSTFTIRIPVTRNAPLLQDENVEFIYPAASETTLEIREVPQDEEKPLILLIEDNLDLTLYISTLLRQQYQVITAPDGETGLKLALETIPDIIISDVMMPKMDGFRLCETLKQDLRTSHIPVVLLTAMVEHEDKIAGLTYGANVYLAKPFDKIELLLQLRNLLHNIRQLQARFGGGKIVREAPKNKDEEFVFTLRELIEAKIAETELNVPELAGHFDLNQAQLSRKLKALTGLTTIGFILQTRLDQAVHLLHHSELNISEVAYQTGFSDPAYFSRAFQKKMGCSPSEFRKTN